MTLPESIPVRYSDEEAGYVSIRPVVRQTFRLDELLDMILSVAGKDVTRVRQILHSGTVVYHFFRYTWVGFDADSAELENALSRFPDADPSREFPPASCVKALFETSGVNPHSLLDLDRKAGAARRLFRRRSFWDQLMDLAVREGVKYRGYSYGQRADLYGLELSPEIVGNLAEAAARFTPRKLRPAIRASLSAARIIFICPRDGSGAKPER